MYETFEHTADMGLRIRAGSLDELFEEAGRGLFSILVANPESIRPVSSIQLQVAGADRETLYFDWLSELLSMFNTRRILLGQFDVTLADAGLTAVVRGEPIDPARHQLDVEMKAITYHGLKVEQRPDGWLAEVIVDI